MTLAQSLFGGDPDDMKHESQRVAPGLKDPVSSVNCWYGSDYCAVVSRDGWVRLFSLPDRCFLRDVFTHNDSGGVSVAFSADDQRCFLGSYHAWGLACFTVSTGECKWKREDLRRFRGLTFSAKLHRLFAYFEGKSALEMDPETGQTMQSFRGTTDLVASPLNDLLLFGDKKSLSLWRGTSKKLWTVSREGFAVLDVAWALDTVAISEARDTARDFGVRCFSTHGELLWRHHSRKTQVSPLMYNPARRVYVGVDYTPGTEDRFLIHWDEETGKIQHERTIPHTMHGALCQRGETSFRINWSTWEFSLDAAC